MIRLFTPSSSFMFDPAYTIKIRRKSAEEAWAVYISGEEVYTGSSASCKALYDLICDAVVDKMDAEYAPYVDVRDVAL